MTQNRHGHGQGDGHDKTRHDTTRHDTTRNNTMNMARAIDMGRYLVVGEPPLNQEGVQHHFGDALCCGGSLTTNREGEVRQAGAGAGTVWHNCTIEKHNCKIVQTRWSRWSG